MRSRIAGDVATTREDNLLKYGLLAARSAKAMFGLEPSGRWNLDDVLAVMVEKVGVSPDTAYLRGADRIDPDLTLDALDRMAEQVAKAARDRSRVLLATGHPAGLLAVQLRSRRPCALRRRRCYARRRLQLPVDDPVRPGRPARPVRGGRRRRQRPRRPQPHPLGGADAGAAGQPRRRRRGPPDLVVADHGWAGAAGQAGIATVGFADCNDPALFAGEAEGKVAVSVPLDDNVQPQLYAPMTAYLLRAAGLGD